MSVSSWEPDPTGRHQHRWWDGQRWTHHVADDGVADDDPMAGLDSLPAPEGPPHWTGSYAQAPGRTTRLGDGRTETLASPGSRLGAWLVDGAVIAALAVPLGVSTALGGAYFAGADFSIDSQDTETLDGGEISADLWEIWRLSLLPSPPTGWGLIVSLGGVLISMAYVVTLIAAKGQTLGKMAAGIKVVDAESGSIPGRKRALRRWTIPGVAALIPFVGPLISYVCFLSLTWRRDRQGWHDSFAGTMVVRVDQSASENARWGRTEDANPVLLATPGARLGARLIDLSIVGLIGATILLLAIIASWPEAGEVSPASFLLIISGPFIIGGLLYEVVMVALRGQTLGKMAMGIEVIRAGDGSKPSIGSSLRRWGLPILPLLIPVIGWLFALVCYSSLAWGDRRRGWHDKAANTLVVVK
ncbi:MAG: RDD family protein [bacterium]|nr:RDD family protein [bacterium]